MKPKTTNTTFSMVNVRDLKVGDQLQGNCWPKITAINGRYVSVAVKPSYSDYSDCLSFKT